MQVSDEVIRGVVREVLAHLRQESPPVPNRRNGRWGVYDDVDRAVTAAGDAQRQFAARGLDDRQKAIQCIRRICVEQAETLGRDEFQETRIGRVAHKIDKLIVAGRHTPGVEFLRTDAYAGGNGVTLTEYAPFGVIGVITPVTHSLPTLAGNAINMLAAGNALVCNPHPSGAGIACRGARLFNEAIHEAIGIDSLIAIIDSPTLESARAIFDHPGVGMLCVTGGPAVGRAALRSHRRAIVAGPGNPPVLVDETADLDRAARSIITGAAFDNNLLCIGEKEVFVVAQVFDELMECLARHGSYGLDSAQVERLTKVAFTAVDGHPTQRAVNKDLIGRDASMLAEQAGAKVPTRTEILVGETDASHSFVQEEQMMPFVPIVRVPDVETGIRLAREAEHGFKHTAIIHSRNIDTITRMGRELDTTLYIQNGPSLAGLGVGGEGYLSFSIATPTGEGVTTPLTFARQRRSTTVGAMRVC
jgi:aldehyde dehydrogenase